MFSKNLPSLAKRNSVTLKTTILLCLLLFNFFSPLAAEKAKLNQNDWQTITKHCLAFLLKNMDNVKISTNESGFYRIAISLPEQINQDITEIRLNYWQGAKELFSEENIHNHPNYFESKIISGGYEHEIFLPANAKDRNLQAYDKYLNCTLRKRTDDSTMISTKKPIYLKSQEIQIAQPGQALVFDTLLIHKILKALPQTLSINAVFKNKASKPQTYSVFFSLKAIPELYINTRINIIDPASGDAILSEVIKLLKQNVAQ